MLLLEGHTADVTALAFAPDGSRLASASWDGTVRLWPRGGGSALILRTGNDHALSVAFSPDGAHLAAGFRSRRPAALGHAFGNIAFIPLIGKPGRDQIAIRHSDTWFAQSLSHGPHAVAFCPTRPWLVATAGTLAEKQSQLDCGLDLYRLPERERIGALLPCQTVRALAFCPDGDELAGISRKAGDGLFVWNISAVSRMRAMLTFDQPLHCPVPEETGAAIAYSPDGQITVGAFESGLLVWWVPGEEPELMPSGHAHGSLRSVAFAPDGSTFVTAGHDGLVKLWDARTRRPLHTFDWQLGDIHCAAFAPDGLTIAAGGQGPVVIWDI